MLAMLIDFQENTIAELERSLNEIGVVVSGAYRNPIEGIIQATLSKPEIVFLDICMPVMDGIESARQIRDKCPDTNIVFITDSNSFGAEAFEIGALDYLLKPVSKERLEKTINRARLLRKPAEKVSRLIIKSFGGFEIGFEGMPAIKRRSKKTKELFAFLLHNSGGHIDKDLIIDNVFENVSLDKALHQLYSTVYYIRKTLKEYGVSKDQIYITKDYQMLLGNVYWDAIKFDECICKISGKHYNNEDIEQISNIYECEYFYGSDWPWAAVAKENHLIQFEKAMGLLVRRYLEFGEYYKAEEALLKIFYMNPYEEIFTNYLLEIYKQTGRKNKAARHYYKYKSILETELGIEPSEEIKNLYLSIK